MLSITFFLRTNLKVFFGYKNFVFFKKEHYIFTQNAIINFFWNFWYNVKIRTKTFGIIKILNFVFELFWISSN